MKHYLAPENVGIIMKLTNTLCTCQNMAAMICVQHLVLVPLYPVQYLFLAV